MITAMDDGIGRILDAVDEAGIAENTIVWFFSDNGGWERIPLHFYHGQEGPHDEHYGIIDHGWKLVVVGDEIRGGPTPEHETYLFNPQRTRGNAGLVGFSGARSCHALVSAPLDAWDDRGRIRYTSLITDAGV